jgi:long-chain acyl-CoA synthetase
MRGYYRDAEATTAALRDGWLHTGDIGEMNDGYLRITDRKNEIFKTSTGKWVAPARIEASIKRSAIVAQAMVAGKGQPYPIALICPNWALLRLSLPGLPADATAEELARRQDVRDFVAHEVRKQTHALATYEQIRHVIIVPHEFSQENGELSPSMKIKRRIVEARYGDEITHAYAAA